MKVIITGATGMVGEGVLHECMKSDHVTQILLITRRSTGVIHPKVNELQVSDFLSSYLSLSGTEDYDACFFCLGVSSLGMKAEVYHQLTYNLTMNFAKALFKINSELVFCYISGAGTDSSEKGALRWARVKGKTENDLLNIGFKAVYNIRPGYLHPIPGLKHTHIFYAFIKWMYPLMKKIAPGSGNTLSALGKSMINLVRFGSHKKTIEVSDIEILSQVS